MDTLSKKEANAIVQRIRASLPQGKPLTGAQVSKFASLMEEVNRRGLALTDLEDYCS